LNNKNTQPDKQTYRETDDGYWQKTAYLMRNMMIAIMPAMSAHSRNIPTPIPTRSAHSNTRQLTNN